MKTGTQLIQEMPIYKFLDENGDGSGNVNANGDYSAAPKSFFIKPAAGEKFFIARMMVHLKDDGSIDSGSYGNGIVLTNGIQVKVTNDSGVKIDITNGLPIKVNPDWGRLCYDVSRSTYGTGNETLDARFTFLKSGVYLLLDGNKGDKLEVICNDDLTGLIEHNFQVQGFKVGTRQ